MRNFNDSKIKDHPTNTFSNRSSVSKMLKRNDLFCLASKLAELVGFLIGLRKGDPFGLILSVFLPTMSSKLWQKKCSTILT